MGSCPCQVVVFFQRNNESVVLGFCPQKSNSKIHKTLSTNATKIKINNLQVEAFNYIELFKKKKMSVPLMFNKSCIASFSSPAPWKSTFISLLMTKKSCWHQWTGQIHHSVKITILAFCDLSHHVSAWPAPSDNVLFLVLSNQYSHFTLLSDRLTQQTHFHLGATRLFTQ